ncbi:MAG: hypothetical protein ABID45_01480 [Patescibacteria group bacterium]
MKNILACVLVLFLTAAAAAQEDSSSPQITLENTHLRLRVMYDGEDLYSNEVYPYQQLHMQRVERALLDQVRLYLPGEEPRQYGVWVTIYYTQMDRLDEIKLEIVELVGENREQKILFTESSDLDRPRDLDSIRIMYYGAMFQIANQP